VADEAAEALLGNNWAEAGMMAPAVNHMRQAIRACLMGAWRDLNKALMKEEKS
jgi:hypothetical protein